jgi:OmpA family
MYGIGPKAGFGARIGLGPQWAVVGGLNGALVYTSFADTGSGALTGLGAYWQLVPQVGAELGVNWRSPEKPSFSITVGGRFDASFNSAIVADGSRRGTLLEFGPFVRAAYNFAGPTRAKHPAVPEDAEEPTKRAGRRVFFDFDRADISPVAAAAIREAADDARHGRPVGLRITSPADGAGDETYDKALALRRSNAVKDELARCGLDSSQIAAVAISH